LKALAAYRASLVSQVSLDLKNKKIYKQCDFQGCTFSEDSNPAQFKISRLLTIHIFVTLASHKK
jgi:hypothetical protein